MEALEAYTFALAVLGAAVFLAAKGRAQRQLVLARAKRLTAPRRGRRS